MHLKRLINLPNTNRKRGFSWQWEFTNPSIGGIKSVKPKSVIRDFQRQSVTKVFFCYMKNEQLVNHLHVSGTFFDKMKVNFSNDRFENK